MKKRPSRRRTPTIKIPSTKIDALFDLPTSRRDQLAFGAMQALIMSPKEVLNHPSMIAREAYAYADAMQKARKQ